MSEIEIAAKDWQEKTWNAIVGCSRLSAGCDNCYAIRSCQKMAANPRMTKKYGVNPYSDLVQIRNGKLDFSGKLHFFEDRLEEPLRIKKPTVWFVNSLSDLYHYDISLDTLKRIFDVMNRAHWHIFDILTKRADRMMELANEVTWTPNIWQGVTFEGIPENMPDGQRNAILSRIPALQQHPARVRFISFEPLIGPILPDTELNGIDWSFFGGESGLNVRPMQLDWLRDGIKLCEKQGCKPHVKQLGSRRGSRGDSKGEDESRWPEDLRPYKIRSLREITPDYLDDLRVAAPA